MYTTTHALFHVCLLFSPESLHHVNSIAQGNEFSQLLGGNYSNMRNNNNTNNNNNNQSPLQPANINFQNQRSSDAASQANNNNNNNDSDEKESFAFWMQVNTDEAKRAMSGVCDLQMILEEIVALHAIYELRGSGGICPYLGVSKASTNNYRSVSNQMQNHKNSNDEPKPLKFEDYQDKELNDIARDLGKESFTKLYCNPGHHGRKLDYSD